ncbi:hypothetical protein FALBO_2737 [Fusarium albosuccineum]|uniref:PHD-type domain-containing protein n=1 Tax=Fusarium albosuccineum TaxID=1237068 RepID=A0A8H4LJ72_9HYPO|nr:hypothetical protein FALBO_2737 [Fusarium albosuccineum]
MDVFQDDVPMEHSGPVFNAPDGDASVANDTNSQPLHMQHQHGPYTPQFSSQSLAILRRLQTITPKKENETSGTVAPQGLGATLPIATPVSSSFYQTISISAKLSPTAIDSSEANTKQDESSDAVDFTKPTIPFPRSAQSISHQPSTMTQLQAQCSKCEGYAQMGQAPLATCVRCLTSYHQQCHSPPITNEAITTSQFTCAACAADQEQAVRLKGKANQQRQEEIERLRRRRLAALPRGVVPAKPDLVGFGAGRAPDSSVGLVLAGCCTQALMPSQRSQYFESMGRTDMLNVLSLCDQLKPNLLADVLVSVSKRHPDLPIFDSPDWETQLSGARRVHKASRHDERPRHGHVLIPGRVRPKKTTKKILKRTRVIEVVTTAQEDQDVLPETWAKAGEGLYSKLPPETEDRGLLMDENDEESFSHFLVDGFGKQIVEPAGA